jgi:maltokinase
VTLPDQTDQPDVTGLAALVAAAAPTDLLPARGQDGVGRPSGTLRLLDRLRLSERCHLLVIADANDVRYFVPAVVDAGHVRRAVAGDGASESLVSCLSRPFGAGSDRFEVTRWHHESPSGERAITTDQTNESVVVGERAVVKWTVRSTPGANPTPQRMAMLRASGFDGMPRPWGLVQWKPTPTADAELVATVVDLVPDATDGWEWAVADVRAGLSGALDLESATECAEALGTLTARMHLALAPADVDAADPEQAAGWATDARAGLREALEVIDGSEGERLASHVDEIAAGFSALAHAAGTPVIPVHGDLHVGQVLRSADGAYLVTDFDGNPVAENAERTAKQPAAVDVASMLQSLDNVGFVVLHRGEGADPAWVRRWRERAGERFLSAYAGSLDRAGRRDLLDDALLVPLRLRQVCREFVYAGRHLPHWRYVPHAALADLYPQTTTGAH